MKNLKIRKAAQEESALLTEIIRNSFHDVAVRFGLTPENCPKHPSNCQEEWVQNDMGRGVAYFLLEEEGRVWGCAAFEVAENGLGYLERLAVLPQKRKQGLGRILVDHVLNQAKLSGVKKVSIGTIAAQFELKKWYQKIGFIETQTKEFAHLPFLVAFMSYDLDKNC